MVATLTIQLNGKHYAFADLRAPSDLVSVIETLGLKTDRIAVEHNGEIIPRAAWAEAQIDEGDRLEIVHFVGGGIA